MKKSDKKKNKAKRNTKVVSKSTIAAIVKNTIAKAKSKKRH